MQIPEDLDKKIDAIISQYPVKRSAAMMAMHLVQEACGYFDDDAVEFVAKKLDVEPVVVYGMLSFYPMFSDKPKGRVHIKVCRTLSCALAGSIKLMSDISKNLNIPVGATSDDGIYTLEFVECIGNCVKGPNVQVNDKLFDNVTPDKAEDFMKKVADMVNTGKLEYKKSSDKPQGENVDDEAYKG